MATRVLRTKKDRTSGATSRTSVEAGQLSFSGKIYDKNRAAQEGGQIACLKNFTVKNHLWKFVHVAFNIHTSDFIAADERGQLYCFRLSENTYSSLRLASFPISALEYIHTHASQVMVAYHNGLVIIVDTLSKEIVANVRPRGSSPVVLLKCCPTKQLAVMLADNGQLILWNLRSLVAEETMQCREAVVDISFLCMARWLSVTFAHSGSIVYDLASLQVVMKCVTPPGERHPRLWTCFCSTVAPHTGGAHSSYTTPTTQDKFSFLAGDNGSIYMFELNALTMQTPSEDISLSASSSDSIPLCPLQGITELPPHITMAVAMTIVTPRHVPSSLSPHVFLLVLGNTGELLLLDGCVTLSDSWQWCVLHAFNPFEQIVRNSVDIAQGEVLLEPHLFAVPSSSSVATKSRQQQEAPYCLASCSIEMESAYYVVIQDEGFINLYDWNAFMDKHIVETEMGNQEGRGEGAASFYAQAWFQQPGGKWLATRGARATTRPGAAVRLSIDTSSHSLQHSKLYSHQHEVANSPPTASHDLSFLSPRKQNPSNVNGLTFSALNKKRCKAEDSGMGKPDAVTPDGQNNFQPSPTQTGESSRPNAAADSVPRNPRMHDRDKPSIAMILDSSTQRKTLNIPKLRKFLKKYGQYPAEHRTLIWRVLLRLPENEKSFAGLTTRGLHDNYEHLYDQYPIRERRVFKRLQGCCSQLAHWNAIFGDVEYVPQMVLPFVVMYGADELSALETVMTVLVWWGRSWQATFPNPPIHITDTLDILLDKHDTNLRAHFYALRAPPGIIGWKMLSTLFSELMPSAEWQILMDHLFTHIEEYSLIYLVPIALMKLLRPSLLSATSSRQIIGFLRQPQTIDIERLLKILTQIQSETSSHLLSACYTGVPDIETENQPLTPGSGGSRNKQKAIHLNLSATEMDLSHARNSVGAQEGQPIFPLPRGGYPTFDGYPPHLLDWQSKERAMALSMKKEIRENESCLAELQEKLMVVEDNHALWMQQQKGIEEKEMKERKHLLEKDRNHLSELSVIEEKIARQRIENLYKIEEIERKELQAMEETKSKMQSLIEMSSHHMKEKVQQLMVSQAHREAGEEADRIMQNKIQALYLQKRKENMLKETEAALRLKQDILDSGNRLKVAVWQQEDTASKLSRHQLSEHAKQKLHEQLIANQKREIDEKAKLIVLEREAKLLEIEKLRTLRTIKEAHSSQLFKNKEDELSCQEVIMEQTLSTESPNATAASGATNMKNLISLREIREPRSELLQMAADVQSSQSKEEERQIKATLRAMKKEHEATMAQLALKKEKIIADKAQSLASTVSAAKQLVHARLKQNQKKQTSTSTVSSQQHGQEYPVKTNSTSGSVNSDDSDALFQQALRFINMESSPGKNGELIFNDEGSRRGREDLSEDMIISAIEIISNNNNEAKVKVKAQNQEADEAAHLYDNTHTRIDDYNTKEGDEDSLSVPDSLMHSLAGMGMGSRDVEALVTAELTDMLSVTSSVSEDHPPPSSVQPHSPPFRDSINLQLHQEEEEREGRREGQEIQFFEEQHTHAPLHSQTHQARTQHSTTTTTSTSTTSTRHQYQYPTQTQTGHSVDADASHVSDTSSQSLEMLETIAARAYRHAQTQEYKHQEGRVHASTVSSSEGSQQSAPASLLPADEALWAYSISGREEFKDLASEFSEDELDETSSV